MSALTPKADIQVVAYNTADRNVRSNFDRLAVTISVVLEATRAAMATDLRPKTPVAVAEKCHRLVEAADRRAGAVINGEADVSRVPEPQAVVDGLMKR
jgi:hypothetical protein